MVKVEVEVEEDRPPSPAVLERALKNAEGGRRPPSPDLLERSSAEKKKEEEEGGAERPPSPAQLE